MPQRIAPHHYYCNVRVRECIHSSIHVDGATERSPSIVNELISHVHLTKLAAHVGKDKRT